MARAQLNEPVKQLTSGRARHHKTWSAMELNEVSYKFVLLTASIHPVADRYDWKVAVTRMLNTGGGDVTCVYLSLHPSGSGKTGGPTATVAHPLE